MNKSATSVSLRGPRALLDLSEPVVMGILNVTPDSFSDGGRYARVDAAVTRGLEMVNEGALILDIGGESTRPGAEPVSEKDEMARVMPVVEALRSRTDVWISVDTTKPGVMFAAARAGADMVNDVTALRSPGGLEVVREQGLAACLMHMQGEPRSMQMNPNYQDVVEEVFKFLRARCDEARKAGVPADAICLDPGFGFGKSLDHNLEMLGQLRAFDNLPAPILVGISRKSMLGKLLGVEDPLARMPASVAAAALAVWQGARIVRTHDVRPTSDGIRLAAAALRHGNAESD